MEFRLFGSPGGNDQIGGTITNPNVSVNQGVFTVNLDFDLGAAAFAGADRYLQIAVRRNAGESFVTLNPRQQITSSPYSIRTLSARRKPTWPSIHKNSAASTQVKICKRLNDKRQSIYQELDDAADRQL